MDRWLRRAGCGLLLTLAGGAGAAGVETVYQRTQADGAVTLTNLPTGEGEQVLVTGSLPPVAVPGSNGLAPSPRADGSDGPPVMALPAPVAPHPVDMPPSIEARSGQLLDAAAASRLASRQAQDAQAGILRAGGAQARLLNLYEASLSAFQARQKGP